MDKKDDSAPRMLLVWNMTGDIWDTFETLFEINPLAKFEFTHDFYETKVVFFPNA